MQDAEGCARALDQLVRHRDATLGWYSRSGVRHHVFAFGGVEGISDLSAADAGWRWASICGPDDARWQAALMVRRLHFAQPARHVDMMREECAAGGWFREPRENVGQVMPVACEVGLHGIEAHGSEPSEAVANWRRIAQRRLVSCEN